MTTNYFNLNVIHSSWKACLQNALTKVDTDYLEKLYQTNDWLPGHKKIFNAFSIPVDKVNYVLFGESPYPRKESANGFAFWDDAVKELWSITGLNKRVNRATSLRNLIKMLLVCENLLKPTNTSQEEIAKIDKSLLVQTNQDFFQNLLNHGFLLLNATPVLQQSHVHKDAKAWKPFIREVLLFLMQKNPSIELILFGQIANQIDQITELKNIKKLYAEHPYNLSFIQNPKVQAAFKPLNLLRPIANSA